MGHKQWTLIACLLIASVAVAKTSQKHGFLVVAENTSSNPFAKIPTPSPGAPELHGGYAGGCMTGASTLPMSGSGYEVMHPERNRRYGHPALVQLIEEAGRERGQESPLLIGDMSLPDGGPMPTGHTSHQIGLDVDVWLQTVNGPLTEEDRSNLAMKSVLADNLAQVDEAKWKRSYSNALMWFAGREQVELIFVNAAIKKRLCTEYPNDERLKKLRPWYGHDDHFHVRLHCPAGQSGCVPQRPPAKLGCSPNDLKFWLSGPMLNWLRHPIWRTHHVARLPVVCRDIANAAP